MRASLKSGAANGAHVSALVSGQVWGNIGGPESNAMANVGKSDPLKAICNLVNRANLYLVARKGLAPKSQSKADLAAFLKGKKFALGRRGGTPDLLGRWLVVDVGLDPETSLGGSINRVTGVDYFNLPQTRSVVFTVGLTR